jgi:AbrB family looped-hinge helix DNA binding protein
MTLVKMKEKGQVTIPAAVRERISAHTGDVFDVVVVGGEIVLKPQDVVSRDASPSSAPLKGVDITSWIGSGRGAFNSPEEVDAFIRAERDQWE